MAKDWKNKLYFGDNLDIMREHIPDESAEPGEDPPIGERSQGTEAELVGAVEVV